MSSQKNKIVTARIPQKYWDVVGEICEREGVDVSTVLREALFHYIDNRERNQRAELLRHLVFMTNTIDDMEIKQEFTATFLNEFTDARQVDVFLAMPQAVVRSSIADAFAKFEPTGVVPEIDITEAEEEVKYKFEKEKAGDNRR